MLQSGKTSFDCSSCSSRDCSSISRLGHLPRMETDSSICQRPFFSALALQLFWLSLFSFSWFPRVRKVHPLLVVFHSRVPFRIIVLLMNYSLCTYDTSTSRCSFPLLFPWDLKRDVIQEGKRRAQLNFHRQNSFAGIFTYFSDTFF